MLGDVQTRVRAFRDELVTGVIGGVGPNISPVEYSKRRNELLQDEETATHVPPFVRDAVNPEQFWEFVERLEGTWADRRRQVYDSFDGLLRFLQSKRAVTDSLGVGLPNLDLPVDSQTEDLSTPFDASSWTGRRTVQQQAHIVMSCAPAALEGLSKLIEGEEQYQHNGGPPLDEDHIEALKTLHRELSELLDLASRGRPFDERMSSVRALVKKCFRTVSGQLVANASSTVAASFTVMGSYYLLQHLTGLSSDASATLSAAIGASSALTSTKRKKQGSAEER